MINSISMQHSGKNHAPLKDQRPPTRDPLSRSLTSLLLPLALLIPFLLLPGCREERDDTALIWTNRPEFASYVELYNAHHEKNRIRIEYVEEPGRAFREVGPGKNAPDIVIGENLNSREMLDKFATLNTLFKEDHLKEDQFYTTPLSQGVHERQHVLLPVSFLLPVITYSESSAPEDLSSFFISLSEMRDFSEQFNTEGEHGLEKLGFSPLWEESMLFTASLLWGADFRETERGLPAWDSSAVTETVDFFREWIREGNEGLEAAKIFSDKYFYEPSHILQEKGRILFYYHDISSYFSIPPDKRRLLDFLWPAEEEKIPVLPPILYMGIPHGAPGITAAKEFISWFFQTETQEKLLDASEYKRIRSFGIAGGFSSLRRVNEEILPKIHPSLVGHIPKESFLKFPERLPINWTAIEKKVVEPWFVRQVRDPEEDSTLSGEIEKWLRQKPE
ncbi:MAG: hypothetical protein ACLFMZ_01025 [Spirochaetaceae bacterium]